MPAACHTLIGCAFCKVDRPPCGPSEVTTNLAYLRQVWLSNIAPRDLNWMIEGATGPERCGVRWGRWLEDLNRYSVIAWRPLRPHQRVWRVHRCTNGGPLWPLLKAIRDNRPPHLVRYLAYFYIDNGLRRDQLDAILTDRASQKRAERLGIPLPQAVRNSKLACYEWHPSAPLCHVTVDWWAEELVCSRYGTYRIKWTEWREYIWPLQGFSAEFTLAQEWQTLLMSSL